MVDNCETLVENWYINYCYLILESIDVSFVLNVKEIKEDTVEIT